MKMVKLGAALKPKTQVHKPTPPDDKAVPKVSHEAERVSVAKQSNIGGALPLTAAVADEGLGFTVSRDLTKVPTALDAAYEKYDSDSSLRASIITASGPWVKRSQASLLSKPSERTLEGEEQGRCKSAAFDLLDALTRSGALPMEHAALHVIMGATHRFEESLMDTVVKGNVNPIEKAERSLLIMASTLHALPASSLILRDHLDRLSTVTPTLFIENDDVAPCR